MGDINEKVQDRENQKIKQAAVVGVISDGHILLGTRNDDGKWVAPGGHVEKGETAIEGAKRELFEEAGIRADTLSPLVSRRVENHDGPAMVNCFLMFAQGDVDPTPDGDPDKEIKEWHWINFKDGLPEAIKQNLHHKDNVLLKAMELL